MVLKSKKTLDPDTYRRIALYAALALAELPEDRCRG